MGNRYDFHSAERVEDRSLSTEASHGVRAALAGSGRGEEGGPPSHHGRFAASRFPLPASRYSSDARALFDLGLASCAWSYQFSRVRDARSRPPRPNAKTSAIASAPTNPVNSGLIRL